MSASQAFRGAATGASMGATFGAPGIVIGAVAGGLAGLFSKSESEVQMDRANELRDAIRARYADTKNKALTNIRKYGAGQASNTRQAATERAVAMGRKDAAESFVLPAEQRTFSTTANLLSDTEFKLDANMNSDLLSVDEAVANRPIDPSPLDYALELGGKAVQYFQAKDALGKANPTDVAKTTTPSTTTKTLPQANQTPQEETPSLFDWNKSGYTSSDPFGFKKAYDPTDPWGLKKKIGR